jgi:universal stress protein E
MKILAATDFSTRSARAVRQAGLLAQADGARLDVVHVVDDDQPEELVRMEKAEAKQVLVEQIYSMPELRGLKARHRVVTGDPFDGILRTATEMSADLIVMGSHRKQLLLDVFIGTTIERVIRKGSFPVLMVNNEAQRKYENVIVPVDMCDASANALRTALSTQLIGDKGAMLLHAFDAAARNKMSFAGADQPSIDEYVASERQWAIDELAAFLMKNELADRRWNLRVEEGTPLEIISKAVSEMRPDLLVMGTHARSAFLKLMIGSVTEEALRSLNVDILAVPPAKG